MRPVDFAGCAHYNKSGQQRRHLVAMAKRNGHPKMFGFLVTAAM